MGLWDSISQAIFGKPAKAAEGVAPTAAAPQAAGKPAPQAAPAAPTAPAATAPKTAAAPAAPAAPAAAVDVAAILDAAVAKSGQKLDWKKSIVDLMKALGLDSSLAARKELATELGYTGDQSDSATMNVWLHKRVIQKLKDNGGKVPADLLD